MDNYNLVNWIITNVPFGETRNNMILYFLMMKTLNCSNNDIQKEIAKTCNIKYNLENNNMIETKPVPEQQINELKQSIDISLDNFNKTKDFKYKTDFEKYSKELFVLKSEFMIK